MQVAFQETIGIKALTILKILEETAQEEKL